MQRRRQPEDNAGQHTDRRDVADHHVIHGEGDPVRLVRILDRSVQPAHTGDGEAEAQGPADAAEHDALDEQLTDDAPAGRAEGDPHGELAGAMRGAREQQVRDVRAGDEQHEADRTHHREEHDSSGAADVSLRERLHPHTDQVLVRLWIGGGKLLGDSVHFRLRLGACRVPSPRRPKMFSGRLFRRRCASLGMNGAQISVSLGKFIPSGMTPTIVAG